MSDYDRHRFPIGPFVPQANITPEEREAFLVSIQEFPVQLRSRVEGLSEGQLETPYRKGGWTVRQVVHHIPDSHLQGYVRFKLAVSENTPTIKTYDQAAWGESIDAKSAPLEPSLNLLDGLHSRWTYFLRSLSDEDLSRRYLHPEMGELSLKTTLQLYAWHGKHHLGHIGLALDPGPSE